jgi:3-dehydroquinate synthase
VAESYLDLTTSVEITNPVVRTVVEKDALVSLPRFLAEQNLQNGKAFIITDSTVAKLYGETVSSTLDRAGIDYEILIMPAGETNKTLEQAARFVEQLADSDATSSDMVIALGGGVVGDLGGFVASIYNRGLPLVQIPTTLLAMVDSSIGGKTGVDHGGKNKTGSFYQPRLVIADPAMLMTLEKRVYTEGFGEVAKYAALDADFWLELESQTTILRNFSVDNLGLLGKLITRCVQQKSKVIKSDPNEQDPAGRILFNYGHTLCHGLEAAGGYSELLHGEAVSIGMNFAAQLGEHLGITKHSFVERQTELLTSLGLPVTYRGNAQLGDIEMHVAKDKKNIDAHTTRFVLPQTIGQMTVQQVPNRVVKVEIAKFLAPKASSEIS